VSNNAAVCGSLPSPWTSSKVVFTNSGIGVLCPGPPPPPQPPSPNPPPPPSPPGAFSVLLSLKAAMTSAWPSALSDWQAGSDPCADGWTGVACDALNVEVVEVDLVSAARQRHRHAAIPALPWFCRCCVCCVYARTAPVVYLHALDASKGHVLTHHHAPRRPCTDWRARCQTRCST
jgi:hypothetical protein